VFSIQNILDQIPTAATHVEIKPTQNMSV